MLNTHGMFTKLGISAVRLQLWWDGLGLQGLAGSGRLNLETAVGGGGEMSREMAVLRMLLGAAAGMGVVDFVSPLRVLLRGRRIPSPRSAPGHASSFDSDDQSWRGMDAHALGTR
jgi:hypothetical protein